jgi:hypothetical protein
MKGHGPQSKGRVAAFHDAASLDREILTAFFLGAAVATDLFGRIVLQTATMRAYGAIRPAGGFKPTPSCVLICELRVFEYVLGHGFAPMARTLALAVCGVNYVIGKTILDNVTLPGYQAGILPKLGVLQAETAWVPAFRLRAPRYGGQAAGTNGSQRCMTPTPTLPRIARQRRA